MAAKEQKPLTLRRNFSWTFIGNIVYAACQWLLLVVLAKLGSPEMVGEFTLGLAVTAPVIMLTNLQLRTIQATDVKQQYIFADYLALRLIATGLGLLIIGGIILVAKYSWEMSLVIIVIGLARAADSISDVFYGLFQQQERMDRIAVSMMIKGLLSPLFLGLGVYLTRTVLWGAVGLAIAWTVVLLCYDIRSGALLLNTHSREPQNEVFEKRNLATRLRPHWHLKTLRTLALFSLPLGFVMMLITLSTNIPRYFIEYYLGERELGIFAAISYLMVATAMVVNALGQSASPRLAKYYAAENGTAFRSLLLKLVGIGILLGGTGVLVASVAGRELITLMYRPEYAEQSELLVWLMVATAIADTASFLGYGMSAARYFNIQLPLFTLVTGTSAIACFWLIPAYGLLGAAIAAIISAIVQMGFSLGVIFHALHRLKSYAEQTDV
ncbi:oligosaccharide flippase family protein [Scytonema millei]|uniref:Oligosaccharide flippase family protein n=1 Tax=Scytonema millei VB511283 TaxID=1245923 RepID=A0A9X5E386_9CYAN|nr:oligosaccharide flippase family protein [Scytonema millei]NHC34193.1 oligosaccharide flippase family protein [Scytonema millei VB511283]